MTNRKLSIIAGISYLVIFLTAIYANFFSLEKIIGNPEIIFLGDTFFIKLGAFAFLVAGIFDVVVAWSLYEIYKNNTLSTLSTYFRIIHATLMGGAVFALIAVFSSTTSSEVLLHIDTFNNLWLIGLLFFGVHLIILGLILKNKIKIIPFILGLAGVMYIVDTGAHFLISNYEIYSQMFLMAVAISSIIGEMSFAIWLLYKGGKDN